MCFMYTITYIIIYITVHPYITFYILYVQHLIIFGVAFHLLKKQCHIWGPEPAWLEAIWALRRPSVGSCPVLDSVSGVFEICVPQNPVINDLFKGKQYNHIADTPICTTVDGQNIQTLQQALCWTPNPQKSMFQRARKTPVLAKGTFGGWWFGPLELKHLSATLNFGGWGGWTRWKSFEYFVHLQ